MPSRTMIAQVDEYNVLRDNQDRELRLYAVTLEIPGRQHRETYHVLSDSEDGAHGMAECAAECSFYCSGITKEEYAGIKRWIVPVALTIQGWGKHQF